MLTIELKPRQKRSSLDQTVAELQRFQLEHSRLPTSEEYDRIARGGPQRDYHFMSTAVLRRKFNSSYYDALSALGFTPQRLPQYHQLDEVWHRLGLPFHSEIRLTIEGKHYFLDFKVQDGAQTYFVEVDGHSHYSIRSIYHRDNRKGLSPKESFQKKLQRDALITQYCAEQNWPLLRFEYYQFLSLTLEQFREVAAGRQSGLSFAEEEHFITQATTLYQAGTPLKLIAAELHVGLRKLMRLRDSGALGPVHQTLKQKIEAADVQIQHLLAQGLSIAAVARELNFPEKTLMQYLSVDGMQRRLTQAQVTRDQILLLIAQGKRPKEIMSILGVSRSYIGAVRRGAKNAN